MKTNIDKLRLSIEALVMVNTMTDFVKGINKDENQRLMMIGIINLHIMEC